MSNPYLEKIATFDKEAGFVDGAIKAVAKLGASAASKVMANPIASKAVGMATRNPMRTALGAGALASGAGALISASNSKEKQACVKMLMDQGVDFEQAVEMTKQASQELYGE